MPLADNRTSLLLFIFAVVTCCAAAVDGNRETSDQIPQTPALTELLKRFDRITAMGFVRTQRSGSTGVGYTLESLLGIRENNSPRGDLLGMEIKAYRDSETEFDDRGKMNLFLKEPEWSDSRTTARRIAAYGYTDEDGRKAWYQSVTSRTNSAGLRLKVARDAEAVLLQRRGRTIGRWTFEVLHRRLTEKLTETVFVAAEARGKGREEEFRYQTVTYCARPSAERLTELIETGDVIVELRMHLKSAQTARNHGTAFRVRKHRLADLFEVQIRCRPQDEE